MKSAFVAAVIVLFTLFIPPASAEKAGQVARQPAGEGLYAQRAPGSAESRGFLVTASFSEAIAGPVMDYLKANGIKASATALPNKRGYKKIQISHISRTGQRPRPMQVRLKRILR
ncbi:MAG: hypothetical protein RDV48_20345 [Candidatus Eremiobacteraeota bacterium]|nr:hypothetical protein [Candidatus Eremiobacteraeota bacterium]